MPPVHPALVHFPIALVPLSVLADLLGFIRGSSSLQAAGWWALAGAAIAAALAVPAGLFDMHREKIQHEAHERVHRHMEVGFTLFAAIAGLTIWRWFIYSEIHDGPGWGYLLAACGVLALTIFQGWLGAELVYSDGVGVAPTGQGTEPTGQSKHRGTTVAGGGSDEHARQSGRRESQHAGH